MDEKILEIHSYTGPGYVPQVDYGTWRVAVLNYCETPESIEKTEKHNETDEVFILTKGKAVLFVGDGPARPGCLYPQIMEIGVIYNVKKAIWHTVVLSRDASILIVENRDTGEKNSDYAALTADEHRLILTTAKQVGI